MEIYLIAFAVVVVVVVGLIFQWLRLKRPWSTSDGDAPGQRLDSLDTLAAWPPEATLILTLPERRAHQLLTRALPDHIVLAQVPLSRFLRVPTRNSYNEWTRRVGRLCADLVVCRTSSQVVAIVNIQQPGKESQRGKKRRARADRVVTKAGIRALAWSADALPPIGQIRELVLGASAPPPLVSATTQHVDEARPTPPDAASVTTELDPTQPSDGSDFVQPTASTFFDDFDSGPMPLHPSDKR